MSNIDIDLALEDIHGITVANDEFGQKTYSIPSEILPDGIEQPNSLLWEIRIITLPCDGSGKTVCFGPVPSDGEPWDISPEKCVNVAL